MAGAAARGGVRPARRGQRRGVLPVHGRYVRVGRGHRGQQRVPDGASVPPRPNPTRKGYPSSASRNGLEKGDPSSASRNGLEKETLLLPAEMDSKKETLLLPAEMDWRAAVPARAGCGVHPLSYSGAKAANRNMWDSGWEMSSRAVTPRPPISRDAMAPRTEGFTYDVGVWDSSIVQGPFSVAPCQTLRYQYLPAVDTTTPGYDDVAMINTVTQTSLLPLVKMVSF